MIVMSQSKLTRTKKKAASQKRACFKKTGHIVPRFGFVTQLIVGVVVFFSIYSKALMGPFGHFVQRIGFALVGDAVSLLPWVLFLTSPILIRVRDISFKRYGLFFSFVFFGLTFIDSFFDHKTLLLHGEIPITFSGIIIQYGATLFGDFGIRFFCFSFACIFGGLLFQLSLADILTTIKEPAPLNLKSRLEQWKYALFYEKPQPIKKRYKKSICNFVKRRMTWHSSE